MWSPELFGDESLGDEYDQRLSIMRTASSHAVNRSRERGAKLAEERTLYSHEAVVAYYKRDPESL